MGNKHWEHVGKKFWIARTPEGAELVHLPTPALVLIECSSCDEELTRDGDETYWFNLNTMEPVCNNCIASESRGLIT